MKDMYGLCRLPIALSAVRLYSSPVLIFSYSQKQTGRMALTQFASSLDRSITVAASKSGGRRQVQAGFFGKLLPFNFQINRR